MLHKIHSFELIVKNYIFKFSFASFDVNKFSSVFAVADSNG